MQVSENISSIADMFFGQRRHPYYIVTPPYKRASAGVVTQHILCHLLNRMGYPAYLVIRPNLRGIGGYNYHAVNSRLITPLLTPELLRMHKAEGLTPITFYPETLRGNPLKAPLVARWVLYYSGAFGGDRTYANDEYVVAFSEAIRKTLPRCDGVISFPVADPRDFHSDVPASARSNHYYYAEKFIHAFGKTVPEHIAKSATRITRDQPDSMTRAELMQALKSAERLYAFEDTAMIYEALLSGAYVVLKPSEHFTHMLGEYENGMKGIAADETPEQIAHAKETLSQYPADYAKWLSTGIEQIKTFADATQKRAEQTRYEQPMRVFISSDIAFFLGMVFSEALIRKLRSLGVIASTTFTILREQGPQALGRKAATAISKKLK